MTALSAAHVGTAQILLAGAIALALLTLGAIAYNVMSLIGAAKFARLRHPQPSALPRVSILKPLKGADPGMYEAFRTHCVQDYAADHEIIFGVSEQDDPAMEYIERLRSEFPRSAISLVICPLRLGVNRKVSNLIQMAQVARHEVVLVNDSDMSVPRDYLQAVAGALAGEGVGMATCLYRGRAGRNLWSKLEAFGVSVEFMPACLAARWVEKGVHYGLGATLALKREALERIGGFAAVADCLADDYELSAAVIAAGYKVELPKTVVTTAMPEYSAGEFFSHQLRWLRAVKASRPRNYVGLALTFGGWWAALAVLLARGAEWSWALLGFYVGLRLVVIEYASVRVIGDRSARGRIWMLPLRELLTPLLWVVGLFGNSIEWRGERFRLEGRLLKPIR